MTASNPRLNQSPPPCYFSDGHEVLAWLRGNAHHLNVTSIARAIRCDQGMMSRFLHGQYTLQGRYESRLHAWGNNYAHSLLGRAHDFDSYKSE